MFRTTGLIVTLAALLCLAGCSDDDDNGGATDTGGGTDDMAVNDQGQTDDKGAAQDDKGATQDDKGATQDDKGATQKDKGATQKDTGPTKKDTGPQPDYGTNKPNTGASCVPGPNICPHKNDDCIIVSGGNQQKGMCLIKCTTKGSACPTDDPKTQKSICFLEFTGPPKELYCAYMCKYNGQTYKCPVGSTCKSIGTNTSICVQQ